MSGCDLPPSQRSCGPLIELAARAGVEERVMESISQCWRLVRMELEPHICLHLAQAFPNRAPRGRKHGLKDAERLVRRLLAKNSS